MTPIQRVEVLKAACCVAGIDGNVGAKEQTLLDKIAREIGVGRASLEAMKDRALTDPDFHRQQFQILNENPQNCLAAVIEVAMADGQISDVETVVLRSLAENLNVPTDLFEKLLSNVSKMM